MSKLSVQRVPPEEPRSLPIFSEFDEVADRIRQRAYELFEDRGFESGHDIEDWFMAEHQVCWPPAEFVEKDDDFEIKVALAGYEPDEISVTATTDEIIVKADHESAKKSEDAHTRFSEFRSNRVYRRFALPTSIEVDEVEASYKNGLLTIAAEKRAESSQSKPRRIEVTSAV